MSSNTSTSDDLILIDDDPEHEEHTPLVAGERVWKILVVDDDQDVHQATQLALRGLQVEGRTLGLLHAYSGSEAQSMIEQHEDLAVMLLDVVMESDSAGLDLVREVRDKHRRGALRIILRTGQPGYAPELDTIRDYDINDYKTKSELTRIRLFTSLTTAVRAYRQIRMHEEIRRGFELVVKASTELTKLHGMQLFAEGVVGQLCVLLNVEPDGLICAQAGLEHENEPARVIAAAGHYSPLIHRPLDELQLPGIKDALQDCLQKRCNIYEPALLLYFATVDNRGLAAYVDLKRPLQDVDRQLLEIFCSSMAVGFDNVLLYSRLVDQAYVDPLLRVPNLNRLMQMLDDPELERQSHTLALVDIDDFSAINDTLGMDFGNEVLKMVGHRLSDELPHSSIARLSGDVLGIIGASSEVEPGTLQKLFAEPFAVLGQQVHLSATSGLVDLNNRNDSGQELLKDANVALKEAKLNLRGSATYFSSTMGQDARERMRLVTGLREAFETQHFFLVYQPKVNLLNGQASGVEALLRWRMADGQLVPPDRFIPVAEQTGLMIAMGTFVLRSGCQQLARLRSAGHTDLTMAINVSNAQLRDSRFIPVLKRALLDAQVPADKIELEITESMASENLERLRDLLNEVRQLGIKIAIDDFGTGFSSLSVLKFLPATRLKIDRSFINEIGKNDSISRMVISLGHSLGLRVTAEGVETEEQRQALCTLGCEEGQGWLFAKPLEEAALLEWLGNAPRKAA